MKLEVVARSATISDCSKYRYLLERHWQTNNTGGALGYIMLNPSTADANTDDPTVRRCMGLAESLGFESIVVANLFAYRATKPSDLRGVDIETLRGPYRDSFLSRLGRCEAIVAAWGTNGSLVDSNYILNTLWHANPTRLNCKHNVWHFGLTDGGHPKHPLFLPSDSQLQRYE